MKLPPMRWRIIASVERLSTPLELAGEILPMHGIHVPAVIVLLVLAVEFGLAPAALEATWVAERGEVERGKELNGAC
jgi:hypothetical protein